MKRARKHDAAITLREGRRTYLQGLEVEDEGKYTRRKDEETMTLGDGGEEGSNDRSVVVRTLPVVASSLTCNSIDRFKRERKHHVTGHVRNGRHLWMNRRRTWDGTSGTRQGRAEESGGTSRHVLRRKRSRTERVATTGSGTTAKAPRGRNLLIRAGFTRFSDRFNLGDDSHAQADRSVPRFLSSRCS